MDVALVLRKSDGTGKTFPVHHKATILGRGQDCDLCVPLQVVSRRHCQISIEQSSIKIRDLRSSNGTFLNGRKINNEIDAKPGDKLRIGLLTFTIQVDGKPEAINIPSAENTNAGNVYEDTDDHIMDGSGTFVNGANI